MGYWKSKVLPKIRKVFEKDSSKKATAAEACKSFVASKEEITKEFEEKKTELQPKVVEIYGAASAEIKNLVKEPKDSGLKKHSTLVQKFLEELVKIDFPGSKPVSEACSMYGAAYVSGPVAFVFEKVSTFVVVEGKAVEPTPTVTATGEEESSSKKKETVVEDEKKEEAAAVVETEKTEPVSSEPAPPVAAADEKTESAPSVAAPVEEAEPPNAA